MNENALCSDCFFVLREKRPWIYITDEHLDKPGILRSSFFGNWCVYVCMCECGACIWLIIDFSLFSEAASTFWSYSYSGWTFHSSFNMLWTMNNCCCHRCRISMNCGQWDWVSMVDGRRAMPKGEKQWKLNILQWRLISISHPLMKYRGLKITVNDINN